MLVVSDLEDMYLPQPQDLLVNLLEGREMLESVLKCIPTLYATTSNTSNALGSALQAGRKLVSPFGGKISVFQMSLPNVGEGALKSREDAKAMNTAKETPLLEPAGEFYKTFAVESSRVQVGIDLFAFPMATAYMDLATLSTPHF